MKTHIQLLCMGAMTAAGGLLLSNCAHEPVTRTNAAHTSKAKLSAESRAALGELYANEPAARSLGKKATAVLVFPKVIRGGFIYGAEAGNGTLFSKSGKTLGYYQTAGASFGLQAGVQKFGYALFLLSPSDLRDLNNEYGWELGASPSVVVVDRGAATSLSTTTVDKGVYAYFFDHKGLMAELSLKGSKITKIHPER